MGTTPKKRFRVFKDLNEFSKNKDLQYMSAINRDFLETTGFPMKYFHIDELTNVDNILSEVTSKTYDMTNIPEIYGWWEGDDPLIELEKSGLLESLIGKVIYINKYNFVEHFGEEPQVGDVIHISYLNKWVEAKEVRIYQHSHGIAYYSTMYAITVEDMKLDGTSIVHEPDADELHTALTTNDAVQDETIGVDTTGDGIPDSGGFGPDWQDVVDASSDTDNPIEAQHEKIKDREKYIKDIFGDDEII